MPRGALQSVQCMTPSDSRFDPPPNNVLVDEKMEFFEKSQEPQRREPSPRMGRHAIEVYSTEQNISNTFEMFITDFC